MNDPTQATRRCMTCGAVKPIVGGFYSSTKKRHRCRACYRTYLAQFTSERAEFLRNYKMERGCMDCGYSGHPAALELDHRPGEAKLFAPNELKSRGTWEQMLDELRKCDVVCANCHRVRTHSRPAAMLEHDLRKPVEDVVRTYRAPDDPDQPGLFVA